MMRPARLNELAVSIYHTEDKGYSNVKLSSLSIVINAVSFDHRKSWLLVFRMRGASHAKEWLALGPP
jgi:hypothetical protein